MNYDFLTKALFFKPQKLPDGYFWTPTAWNIIKIAKNERFWADTLIKSNSSYTQFDNDFLTKQAEQLLYQMQSSNSNYMDIIVGLVAFICLGLFLNLIPEMWNYHRENDVKLFFITIIVSIITYLLYRKKKELDDYMVMEFLTIEFVLDQRNQSNKNNHSTQNGLN